MPLLRVPGNEAWLIGRALDLGARGVVVPLVSTPEEATRAARACRYPPDGARSWGAVRSSGELGSVASERNAAVLCIVMIETVQGVENLEAICGTPGVDAVYVGPRDLALDHGLERAWLDADRRGRLDCRRLGLPAGIHTGSGEAARHAIETGFSFATIASDRDLLARAARAELAAALRREPESKPVGDEALLRATGSYI
jgi:4-hydroxy-2-oxoheptanedioate aldolase